MSSHLTSRRIRGVLSAHSGCVGLAKIQHFFSFSSSPLLSQVQRPLFLSHSPATRTSHKEMTMWVGGGAEGLEEEEALVAITLLLLFFSTSSSLISQKVFFTLNVTGGGKAMDGTGFLASGATRPRGGGVSLVNNTWPSSQRTSYKALTIRRDRHYFSEVYMQRRPPVAFWSPLRGRHEVEKVSDRPLQESRSHSVSRDRTGLPDGRVDEANWPSTCEKSSNVPVCRSLGGLKALPLQPSLAHPHDLFCSATYAEKKSSVVCHLCPRKAKKK